MSSNDSLLPPAFDRAHSNSRRIGDRICQWIDSDHICVLTIGKTASSAIISGLEEARVPAFQVHSLVTSVQTSLFVRKKDIRPAKELFHKLKIACWLATKDFRNKKFITTFRDPFDRNISAFFEQAWKLGIELNRLNEADLIRYYNEYGPHDATRQWFQANITRLFGIQACEVDLRDQTTRVVTRPHIHFLFMKHENQDNWQAALSDFSGVPIKIPRRNSSSNKTYRDQIALLRKSWRPSRDIIKRTIDKELWSVLYTKAEKEKIYAKWDIDPALAR